MHQHSAQATPLQHGIPWLGFVIYPSFRRIKARKVHQAKRRLSGRYDAWRAGEISFAEFDASIKGWINHVRYADSWRLREDVLHPFVWGPEAYREKNRRRCAAVSGQQTSGQ